MQTLLPQDHFDSLAVGVVDFKKKTFECSGLNYKDGELTDTTHSKLYFDLASMTKVLTNSLSYFLQSKKFTSEMLLCLNHRGGLPAWGLLPHDHWREQILGYKIQESETLYSDFSALRVMLDSEKQGIEMKKVCQKVWDKEMLYWLDLSEGVSTPQYGFKRGQPNFGEVHDPNAWVIRDFCSHAGLFATIQGTCQTLLNYQEETGFIEQTKAGLEKSPHRFCYGWDRVENPEKTLAGKGCGKFTFGHLGFTGTSVWIDPDKMLGHVILSNATKDYWYDKDGINDLRRAIGESVWKQEF